MVTGYYSKGWATVATDLSMGLLFYFSLGVIDSQPMLTLYPSTTNYCALSESFPVQPNSQQLTPLSPTLTRLPSGRTVLQIVLQCQTARYVRCYDATLASYPPPARLRKPNKTCIVNVDCRQVPCAVS